MAPAGGWRYVVIISFFLIGVSSAAGGRADPVPSNSEAFRWAVSRARLIRERGGPTSFEDGRQQFLSEIVRAISDMHAIPRTTAFVEIFSGVARCARAVRDRGHRVFTYDMLDHEWQNVVTLTGCLYIVWILSSICPGGAAWFGPQCSTWITMSRGHTKRTDRDPYGTETRQDVREANWTSLLLYPGAPVQRGAAERLS
eukprot:8137293-Pyramimonas_sp.AAC.1